MNEAKSTRLPVNRINDVQAGSISALFRWAWIPATQINVEDDQETALLYVRVIDQTTRDARDS